MFEVRSLSASPVAESEFDMARFFSAEVRRLCEELQECRDPERLLELARFLADALDRECENSCETRAVAEGA
jgi:hypothetical protein